MPRFLFMNKISLSSSPGKILSIDFYGPNSGLKLFYSSIEDLELRSQIKEKIYTIGDVQKHQTNIKAAMTNWDSQSDPIFARLVKEVTNIIVSISDEYYFRPDILWEARSCWGSIYRIGEYAQLHDHYPATWSAVYYAEQPNGGSCLNFPGPQLSVLPVTGSLIVFPGNIEHEVPPSVIPDDRIVVAINFYVKKISSNDSRD